MGNVAKLKNPVQTAGETPPNEHPEHDGNFIVDNDRQGLLAHILAIPQGD